MLKNRLKLVVGMLAVCFLANTYCCVANTNAVKCKDVTLSNTSLYYACNGTVAEGAMWVSSSSSTSDISAVVDTNQRSGNITVYLHGVVIDNDGDTSDKKAATCVRVVQKKLSMSKPKKIDAPQKSGGNLTCALSAPQYNDASKGYVSDILDVSSLPKDNTYGAKLPRELVKRGKRDRNNKLTDEGADEIKSTAKAVTLNIDNAIAGKSCTLNSDNTRCTYTAPVYVFRCFEGNEGYEGYCYSSTSNIQISVPVDPVFQGISTVVNGYDTNHNDWNSVTDNNRKAATDLIPGGTKDKAVLGISGCDNGCQWVRFSHGLKRISGSGGTGYRVYRYFNDTSISPRGWVVGDKDSFISVNDFSGTTQKIVRSELQTMYTGQSICEQIGFYANGSSDLKGTTACAIATGTVNTELKIKVKNKTLGHSDYVKTVYAKPGDEVEFRATYNPKVQSLINRVPNKLKIDGTEKSSSNNSTLKDVFNSKSSNNWKNVFAVSSQYCEGGECSNGGFSKIYDIYNVGDASEKNEPNSRTIGPSDVGRELKEITNINGNNNVKTTPKQVVFSKEGTDTLVADVKTGSFNINSEPNLTASVIVPYNFVNVPSVEGTEIKAYAGENFNIPYKITTQLKSNSLVGGDPYATFVKNARWKTGVCTDRYDASTCTWNEPEEGNLHDGADTSTIFNVSEKTGNVFTLIPDYPAGTEIYVRAAVYPAESSESDWGNPEGNRTWAYSDAVPVTVAKKPSFQVWGGDVFVENEPNIMRADKILLNGYQDFAPRSFGSWGELAVDFGVGGSAGWLASGATLGFSGNNNGTLAPQYTFKGGDSTANYKGYGNNTWADDPGGSNTSDGDKLTFNGGGMVNIDNLVSMLRQRVNGKGGVVIESPDSETIAPMEMTEPGVVQLYDNEGGDIKIEGNIEYKGNYTEIESIPKVIIYANNINISCNVERIDAILIAKDVIDTCSDIADGAKNKVIASRQLYINGAVIAGNQLKLKRTYGAGTGANSMIPAEIINMDPSWYLWAADIVKTGESEGGSDGGGLMIMTYTHELPPRY